MQLRPHQREACDAMLKHNRGQIIVPTGGCQTIEVTPHENNKLSQLTENRDGNFVVHVPTHEKYEHLNIVLFHPDKGVVDNIFNHLVPIELVEYEKQYLSN